MTTKRLALLIALFLGVSVNAHAMYRVNEVTTAPDRVGRVDWGLGAASAMNDDAEDSLFISTSLAYGVTPYIAIGVEAGWQEADGAVNESISFVPVLADIVLRLPTIHESLVPYVVLGLGGAGITVDQTNRSDVDDTGFAWKLGAGLDYFLNSNWLLNLEFSYWGIDVSLPGTSLSTEGTSFWTLGGGIKYLF